MQLFRGKRGSRVFSMVMVFIMVFSQFASVISAEETNGNQQAINLENVLNGQTDDISTSNEGNQAQVTSLLETEVNGEGSQPADTSQKEAVSNEEMPADKNADATEKNPADENVEATEENQPAETKTTEAAATTQPEAVTQPNLTGQLLKGTNTLGLVTFSFHSLGENQIWYDVTTDASGEFATAVPDGSYIIEGIWLDTVKKWYPIQHEFEVSGSASLELNLQPGNVMGQVVNGSAPVADVLINAFSVNAAEQKWYHATTNKSGQFHFNLPDGDYQIDGLWVETEKKWYQKPTAFTIQNGVMLGQELLNFNISSSKILGTLSKAGAPLSNEAFSVVKTDGTEQWYDVKTDSAGSFSFELPDGTYLLEGIWVAAESKWYSLQQSFKVVNGALESGQTLNIDLAQKKTGNVLGTLTNGNQPVANVWFSAHTVGGEEKWFDTNTDTEGHFSFELSDGVYQIDGVWDTNESKWYVLNKQFTVTNGELEGMSQLDISLSENANFNVSGVVLNGTDPVAGVEVNAHTTADGVQNWYSTTTNTNGQFVLTLPNGSFTIEGIWLASESKWYELPTPFVVENGQLKDGPLTLNLQAQPKQNVSGQLTKGTKPLANVTFSTYSTEGEVKWYSSQSDDQGRFAFSIPDGHYQIDGIWVEEEAHWYAKKTNFTVTNGVLVGAPTLLIDVLAAEQHPISGTLVKGAEKLGNVTFSFHSVGETEVWYDTTTSADGTFTMERLPDGTYVVEGVWLPAEAKWYELHYSFEVVGGQVQGDFIIDLLKKTNPNISGLVKDENGPIADVQVSIYSEGSNENGIPFFTNEQGQFNATLADGSYQVRYLFFKSSETALVQTVSFEVKDGKLYKEGQESELLEITVPKENVFGTITRDGVAVADAQLLVSTGEPNEHFLHAAISDESGAFTLRLPDGSYTVVGIFLAGTYHDVQVPFTVKNGVADAKLQLTLDSVFSISGKVVDADGNAVINKEVMVINEDETLIQDALTNETGEFVFELPNGSYTIFQIGDQESGYTLLDYSFTIENGKLFENGVEKESLQITLPRSGNVSGVVTGGDASLLNGTISIRSKGEQPVWYRPVLTNGRFQTELPDGEYTFIGLTIGEELSLINQSFQVVNGKLLIDGVHQAGLHAELPPKNFKLSFAGVDPTVDDLHLSLRPLSADGFYIGLVPEDASSIRLADGEYEIYRVIVNGTTYDVTIGFEVMDGELYQKGYRVDTILVDITPITFQGILKNEDGTPISNAEVIVRNQYYIDFVATTDEEGYFAFQLEDGTYSIKGYYLKETNEQLTGSGSFTITNGKSYMNGQEFSGLAITLPKITVRGVLYDGGQKVANMRLTVISASPFGIYQVNTNKDGAFVARFPDGNYSISSFGGFDVGDSGTINLSFQVLNGKTYVRGVQKDVIDVQCPPKSLNVIFKNGETPLANLYMHIEYKTDPTKGYEGRTDSEGKFSLRVPDGEYYIKEAVTISGGSSVYPLNRTIWVQNGKTNPNPYIIDVSVPTTVTGNVRGVVTDGVEKFAFAEVEITGNSIVRTTATNSAGEFGIQLEDGQFTINHVKTVKDGEFYQNISFEIKGGKVYVGGVEKTSFTLSVTPVTLSGMVTDGTNHLVGAEVNFIQEEPYYHYSRSAVTDSLGRFTYRLKDGVYYVDNVWYQNRSFSFYKTYFSIKNNELFNAKGEKITSLDFTIPKVTLKGTVSLEGSLLASALVKVTSLNSYSSFSLTTDSQGMFEARLYDGDYRIESIEKSNQNINFGVDERFSIRDGQMHVINQKVTSLDFHIPKETFIGTIFAENAPLSGARIELQRMETGTYFYIDPTTVNGEMMKRLPDGNYVIIKVIKNGTFPIYKSFTISKGELVGEPISIDSKGKVNQTAIKGSFADGANPIANSQLRFYQDGQWHYVSTDARGDFAFEGVDGRYSFKSYLDSSNRETDLSLWNLYFMVVNGKMVLDGQMVDHLTLKMPPYTTAIQVVDQGVVLANQNVTIEFLNGYDVYGKTDENGKILVRLPQGRYYIDMISFYLNGFIEADMTELVKIEQSESVQDIVVDLSTSSFLKGSEKGRVILEDGSPAAKYANITYTNQQNGQSETIRTNAKGEFSFDLTNGSYKINLINMSAGGGQSYLEVNVPFAYENGKFTVNGVESENLDIILPPFNVEGVLVDASGNPIANAYLPHSGASSVSVYTDKDGKFGLRLKDGDYTISTISLGEETRKVDIRYSVVNGRLTVNGVEQEELTIQLAAITFNGKATFNGKDVVYGTMDVKKKNAEGEYVKTYTASTDYYGVFKENYPDGDYLITTVESYSSGETYLGVAFSISNGVMVVKGEEVAELNLVLPSTTVNGTLLLYGQPAADMLFTLYATGNDYLDGFEVYANSLGNFTYRLADGAYKIQTVTYKGKDYTINSSFTVKNGVVQPSPLVVELSGTSKSAVVSGQLLDDGKPPVKGWITFRNKYFTTSSYTVQYDAAGNFKVELPDGAYVVSSIQLGSFTADIPFLKFPFEIVNGELKVNGEAADALPIHLPKPITGLVTRGGIKLYEAMVAIEPKSGMSSTNLRTDINGNFRVRLADGFYTVKSVSYNYTYYSVNLGFEVSNGVIKVNGLEKSILDVLVK
jgi:hypothetical protein